MKMRVCFLCFLAGYCVAVGQQTLRGVVVDGVNEMPLQGVKVYVDVSDVVFTARSGKFEIKLHSPVTPLVLWIVYEGYLTKKFALGSASTINLGSIALDADPNIEQEEIGVISLSDNDLAIADDGFGSLIVPGLLTASKAVFARAAAFDFSAAFYRPRGLDNSYSKVMLNGMEMNELYSNRPQWSFWGGINDVQRNQSTTRGLELSSATFGGAAGSTNIILRASQYRKGGRVSYAFANRSYMHRIMASYSSGLHENGWAYTFLASRRYGSEGYVAGTPYNANSFFGSIEKQIGSAHALNFVGMYTPNHRGRNSSLTNELFALKGRRYNPYWGFQNGKIRNARTRTIQKPLLMLNHYWDLAPQTTLNSAIAYQWGSVKNSRLDNSSVQNPAPDYYQRLPSFHLSRATPDYTNAFLAQQALINDGQIDWESLYAENRLVSSTGGSAVYALQDDVAANKQLMINSAIDATISDRLSIMSKISFTTLNSENYAQLKDLLGAVNYLDIDNFSVSQSQDGREGDGAQSDINNPNRYVTEGERYKYNYSLAARVISGFLQAQYSAKRFEGFLGVQYARTSYRRDGLYNNGRFNGVSFGKSKQLAFSDIGAKLGVTYKFSGRHIVNSIFGYYTQAPTLRNSFVNPRQNNSTPVNLESEQINAVTLKYTYRSPIVTAACTGYYTGFKNGTDLNFYFTENSVKNGNGDFVQEFVDGIARSSYGFEFGAEAKLTSTLKVKAAGALGQHVFTKDGNATLYTQPDLEIAASGDANQILADSRIPLGTVALKNYHVATGPERVLQLGFEYRDPNFWWIGATANHFSHAYIDISTLARTSNFNKAPDGLDFPEYNEAIARQLLTQEQIPSYVLVNVVGGKSWRVKSYYVGFFAALNNVLNTVYRTGGFEQSRRANYRTLLQESQLEHPVFGNRYFFGNGSTFYVNFYCRF